MRAVSHQSSVPRSRFKAAWLTFAAASMSGLAVLGACSDGSVASKVQGPGIESPRFDGVVGGTAHNVMVCVDLLSDPGPGVGGTYSFAVSAMPTNVIPFPWYELQTSSDPDLSGFPTFITQNSQGPFNAVTDNDVITANLLVAPGDCKEAFERANTCPGGSCTADPATHPGNRLWTDANGTTNPYGSVAITATNPPGFTMGLDCINDDPGNPLNCTNGGYGSANVFHGSTFTYTFEAPEQGGCTYTHGWYKNKGNSTVPLIPFFGPVVGGNNTGPLTWRAQVGKKATAYDKLAYQYIAAKLSVGGGTPPAAVAQALLDAEAFFTNRVQGTGTPPAGVATILDNFVNGQYAGWPHCD